MKSGILSSLILIWQCFAGFPAVAAGANAANAPTPWGAYFRASPGVLNALAPNPRQASALVRLMDHPLGVAPDFIPTLGAPSDQNPQAQAALIEPALSPMVQRILDKARESQPASPHDAQDMSEMLRDILAVADMPGVQLAPEAKEQIRSDEHALEAIAQGASDLQRIKMARTPSFDGGRVTYRAEMHDDGTLRIEDFHPSEDFISEAARARPIPDHLAPWLPSAQNTRDWTGRVTLHLHSIYSDGTMSPAAVVQAAYDKGVRKLALTDHDTLAGVTEAWEKVREINAQFPNDTMEFHPGAELTSRGGVHIGAVDVDISQPKLVALVERVRIMRYQRAQAIIRHLNERFEASADPKEKDVRITIEEVVAKSQHKQGGTIELPHIARVLVDKGLIQHVDDAFNSYLKGNIGGSAGGFDPTADEVLEAIRAAGGKAFLNHPYTMQGESEADKEQKALDLLRQGMDGIEIYRPSHATSESGKRRLDQRVAQYLTWIEKLKKEGLNLVAVPGADFHGLDTHLNRIVVWMPKVLAQELLDLLSSARDAAIAALERGAHSPAAQTAVTTN